MIAEILVKSFFFGLLALGVGLILLQVLNRRLEKDVEHSYNDGREGYDPGSIKSLSKSIYWDDDQSNSLTREGAMRVFVKQL